ncbi:hypothetical protein B0J14DRAFT_218124 [Halenospora varia]|nr:hypothetical protein B0J14DRAFT_218124 [Halenospora varia]
MPDFLLILCALFNNNAPPTCSRRCVPHVTSHLSWNQQRADRSGGRFHATWSWVTIPRYVLQCPDMAGPLVGRAPVRFAFCHRIANTEDASSLPLSHLLRAELSISSLYRAPVQTMSMFAQVHRAFASAKSHHGRAHAGAAQSRRENISFLVSARESDCYVEPQLQ